MARRRNSPRPPIPARIVKGIFTSYWDGASVAITTSCKVDLDNKEVINIKRVNNKEVEVLDGEEVTFTFAGEEVTVPVYQKDDAEEGDYWYE